jgi:hypothetical protein
MDLIAFSNFHFTNTEILFLRKPIPVIALENSNIRLKKDNPYKKKEKKNNFLTKGSNHEVIISLKWCIALFLSQIIQKPLHLSTSAQCSKFLLILLKIPSIIILITSQHPWHKHKILDSQVWLKGRQLILNSKARLLFFVIHKAFQIEEILVIPLKY